MDAAASLPSVPESISGQPRLALRRRTASKLATGENMNATVGSDGAIRSLQKGGASGATMLTTPPGEERWHGIADPRRCVTRRSQRSPGNRAWRPTRAIRALGVASHQRTQSDGKHNEESK